MAISPKPTRVDSRSVDVESLIKAGGTPAEKQIEAGGSQLVLRIPSTMLSRIDECVRALPIKTPRHRWILEALYEKLAREEKLQS